MPPPGRLPIRINSLLTLLPQQAIRPSRNAPGYCSLKQPPAVGDCGDMPILMKSLLAQQEQKLLNSRASNFAWTGRTPNRYEGITLMADKRRVHPTRPEPM